MMAGHNVRISSYGSKYGSRFRVICGTCSFWSESKKSVEEAEAILKAHVETKPLNQK